jgi:hypothetical protein
MTEKITLGTLVGTKLEEEFIDFDLTEIQDILRNLQNTNAIDLAHAEILQQKALRGADIITEYLAKLVKTVSYLESKYNSTKNKISLEYKVADGSRTTVEMKKWAGEAAPEVEELAIKLAQAKGSKSILEKKYDILIKLHHHYKDISSGLRKTVLGYNNGTIDKSDNGW